MMPSFKIEDSPLGRICVASPMPPGFALLYTTIDFRGFLDAESLPMIRGLLRDRFEIDASLSTCHQVHGNAAIEVVAASDAWCELDSCDALWSSAENVALGIKVADCLPVTLIDPRCSTFANIHAGWRGSAAQIVARTVADLRAKTSFEPGESIAFLGPSIRQCCFEVGPEVIDQFRDLYPNLEHRVDTTRGDRPYLDLAGVTTDVLESLGFLRGSIHDSKLCTRCSGSIFHSYRRDRASSGRNLAIVARG